MYLIQAIINFFQIKFSSSQHIISANSDPHHACADVPIHLKGCPATIKFQLYFPSRSGHRSWGHFR